VTAVADVFGAEYAAAYDALYEEKDYLGECDLIERVFVRYGQGQVQRVLDLGCGTGGHAWPLAARGYQVVGVDRSPHMLERARAHGKATLTQVRVAPRFELSELGSLDLGGERFDAALLMFGVLCYQHTNADLQAALASARRHLRPGGLLFADAWYGPAVLSQRPAQRIKVIDRPAGEQVIRVASSDLDTRHNLCTVRYHLWRISEQRVLAETREVHTMRYLFAPELELLLAGAGFELLRLASFPDFFEAEATEASWNVALAARAA
jgi:SAM-dependent methyltransferase